MITWSDLRDGFWLGGFLLLTSTLVLLPIYAVARFWITSSITSPGGAKLMLRAFLGSASLGFTGMVAGFLTGSSRAPAVTALVPAILIYRSARDLSGWQESHSLNRYNLVPA
jgi:hypothetical protein